MDNILSKISGQGQVGMTYYSINDVNTPIVIVGSSRASHHYVTKIIEDSLQTSLYNVARDGCFFSYNCCIINSILDRYSPQMIIWENGTEYLAGDFEDSLVPLYPYFNKNKWVTNTIKEELPWTEYARLWSNIYKYNSIFHRILLRYKNRNSFADKNKGYIPLTPNHKVYKIVTVTKSYDKLNNIKIERFRTVLSRARDKGVKMVIIDSPKYVKIDGSNLSAAKMKELCKQYGALYIDNSELSFFLERPELFNDRTHMNDVGAKIYTQFFIQQIKDF
ncbi:MAG: hypothetical protein ACI31F_01275 [Muribaculaceae bacterium]